MVVMCIVAAKVRANVFPMSSAAVVDDEPAIVIAKVKICIDGPKTVVTTGERGRSQVAVMRQVGYVRQLGHRRKMGRRKRVRRNVNRVNLWRPNLRYAQVEAGWIAFAPATFRAVVGVVHGHRGGRDGRRRPRQATQVEFVGQPRVDRRPTRWGPNATRRDSGCSPVGVHRGQAGLQRHSRASRIC